MSNDGAVLSKGKILANRLAVFICTVQLLQRAILVVIKSSALCSVEKLGTEYQARPRIIQIIDPYNSTRRCRAV